MPRPSELTSALVRKGEAAPVAPETAAARELTAPEAPPALPEPPPPPPPTPAPAMTRPQRASAPRRAPQTTVVELEPPPEAEEARVAVTTRILASIQERIRILAFRTRRTKQAVIDAALAEYLERHGG